MFAWVLCYTYCDVTKISYHIFKTYHILITRIDITTISGLNLGFRVSLSNVATPLILTMPFICSMDATKEAGHGMVKDVVKDVEFF